MSYVTQNTTWPAVQIDERIRSLIDRFYRIADTNETGAAEELATVFTADATFASAGGRFRGSKEIVESRKDAWDVVKARRHTISKVYANAEDGRDLILAGHLRMELKDGSVKEAGFLAHVVVDAASLGNEQPRFSHMEVFTAASPPSN